MTATALPKYELRKTAITLGVIALAVAAGLAASTQGILRSAVFALGAFALSVLVASSSDRLLRLSALVVIVATFWSRQSWDVSGFSVRPEQLLLPTFYAAMIVRGKLSELLRAAKHPAFVFLGAYILWTGGVSFVTSPDPVRSTASSLWLLGDWLVAIGIVSVFRDAPATLERSAMKIAAVVFAVTIGVWFAAWFGGLNYGLQEEWETGSRSLYGFALEANVLASSAAFWSYLALTSKAPGRWRQLLIISGLAVVALALTRAALVGFFVGVLVFLLMRGRTSKRRVLGPLLACLAVLAIVAVSVPSIADPVVDKAGKLGQTDEGTGGVRTRAVNLAFDDLRHQPAGFMVGLGQNSFGQRHSDDTVQDVHKPSYLGVFLVEVLYSSGLVGVLLLAMAAFSLRSLRGPRTARGWGLVAIFLTAGLATSPFWLASTWILICLGVLASEDRQRTDGAASSPAVVRERSRAGTPSRSTPAFSVQEVTPGGGT